MDYMVELLNAIEVGMPPHLPGIGRYDYRGPRGVIRGAGGATLVGGPAMEVQQQEPGPSIDFRRATTFRTTQLQTTSQILIASAQLVNEVINGSGYIYGIDLYVAGTGSVNGAAGVAFDEDGPWNVLDSVVLKDVNGEVVNLTGFDLRLANLYGGWTRNLETGSADSNVYSLTTGAVASGGDFSCHMFVPVAINRRTLLGLLGNQDRAQSYELRTDIAASGTVFTTPPDTTLPTIGIERMYENYAVPAPTNAAGAKQEQFPPKFGVIHYLTRSTNPSAPAGGSTINHYLNRLGNTIRFMILVLRSNGSRATAEANLPSRISFLLGDTPIFTETVEYRRKLMFDRYNFDAPDGVLVYDFITDMIGHAADELGSDYLFTNGLVNAQFQITYPAGFGAANNSLVVITDDMIIPPNVDIYS